MAAMQGSRDLAHIRREWTRTRTHDSRQIKDPRLKQNLRHELLDATSVPEKGNHTMRSGGKRGGQEEDHVEGQGG